MHRLTELDGREKRVLGALVEKELATPEYYPMTLKGLVAACNQKSNRDPVLSLSEIDVLNTLRVLSQEDLVERVAGARVDRWAHRVDEHLAFDSARKALVTLLLLRGPQTAGELRGRSQRLNPFQSRTEVEALLGALSSGEESLVVLMPRQPGQKEGRWALRSPDMEWVEGSGDAVIEVAVEPPLEKRVKELEEELRGLRQRIDDLEKRLL